MPGQVVSAQPGQPFVDDRVGCGVMGASAIADTVVDPSLFRLGREFAAWPEMTPRQNSSGGEERLGNTSSAVTNTFAACSSPTRLPCCAMPAIDQQVTVEGVRFCSASSWRPGLSMSRCQPFAPGIGRRSARPASPTRNRCAARAPPLPPVTRATAP